MNSTIRTLLATDAGLAATVLRIPTGIIFAAHGSQKLFGAFGGYGLEGVGQWMASIGLEPGYLMALLAVITSYSIHYTKLYDSAAPSASR